MKIENKKTERRHKKIAKVSQNFIDEEIEREEIMARAARKAEHNLNILAKKMNLFPKRKG